MKTFYNDSLGGTLVLDKFDHVRSIFHNSRYWTGSVLNPAQLVVEYLLAHNSYLSLPEPAIINSPFPDSSQADQTLFISPVTKRFFDSEVIEIYQQHRGLPVWRCGLSVLLKHHPLRVISVVNNYRYDIIENENYYPDYPSVTLQFRQRDYLEFIQGSPEYQSTDFHWKKKFTALLNAMFDEGAKINYIFENGTSFIDTIQFHGANLCIFKYVEEERLSPQVGHPVYEYGKPKVEDLAPVLPLKSLSKSIKDGNYYQALEICLSLDLPGYGNCTWIALTEINSGGVLYLRPKMAGVQGLVFKSDPVSRTGDQTLTYSLPNRILNTYRENVTIPRLDPPVNGIQYLSGVFIALSPPGNDHITPPALPVGQRFDFEVRSYGFAAVNAYYLADWFFNKLEHLGFSVNQLFSRTTFPIQFKPIHTGVSASEHTGGHFGPVLGYVSGGIEEMAFGNIENNNAEGPIGSALFRHIFLHEMAHALQCEHAYSLLLGFCHSVGDALALIMTDPQSRLTGDARLIFSPWWPMRNANVAVEDGWAWGGSRYNDNYDGEKILTRTLFRIYTAIGGDATELSRREFASDYMVYLIIRTITNLTPSTNAYHEMVFAQLMMATEVLNWVNRAITGGAYQKVVRWAFEKQGLYQAAPIPRNVISVGRPPQVDVYIEDGRGGDYFYQEIFWKCESIWNRTSPNPIEGHQHPVRNNVNYAFVKIKNRGYESATEVKVRAYHARPSAGLRWPQGWEPMQTAELGLSGNGTLASNNSQEVIIGPFQWIPTPDSNGHDCMLMIVSALGDPSNVEQLQSHESIPEWQLVPNDNNVAQRNIVVVDSSKGSSSWKKDFNKFHFWIANPEKSLAVITVKVRLPAIVKEKGWSLSLIGMDKKGITLKTKAQKKMKLLLKEGKECTSEELKRSKEKDIVIYVMCNGAIIGGMTYRLITNPNMKFL